MIDVLVSASPGLAHLRLTFMSLQIAGTSILVTAMFHFSQYTCAMLKKRAIWFQMHLDAKCEKCMLKIIARFRTRKEVNALMKQKQVIGLYSAYGVVSTSTLEGRKVELVLMKN